MPNPVLEQLRKRRDAAKASAGEIVAAYEGESRPASAEEAKKFGELMAEYDSVKADIERRERLEAAVTDDAVTKRQTKPEIVDDIHPGARIEVPRVRHGSLRAFKGTNADENAFRSGMWLKATVWGDNSARDWCREHGVETRVQTEGVNTKGGYLVPTELEQAIIDLRETYGLARAECNVYPMSSDHVIIPRRTSGVTAYFVGEEEATTASDMAWDQVALTAKELSVITRVSKSLSEDAIVNIADQIATEIAYAFAKKEDECLIDGTGISTYGGITGFRTKLATADGTHSASTVEAVATNDTFVELDLVDIIPMIGKLPKYAEANAKWYMSPYCWGAAFLNLMAAAGGNLISSLAAGAPKTFMGYPVVTSPAMPASTDAYDAVAMFVFGDLRKAATLGNRRGITIEVDNSRYLEYRQIAILGTERFDINVHDLGDTSTAGPLIGFLGNTA